jgi:Sortase domain
VDVLDPTSDRTLTLVTCYPFSYFGSAPDRFVVRATRVDDPPEELAALPSHPFGPMDVPTSTEASRVPREPAGKGGGPVGPGRTDESVVLQAIERFRIVYNGVLARRGETRPEGPLVFGSCQVTMEDNKALAHCETLQTGPSSSDSAVWTFSLARVGPAWDVKSIAPN